MKVKKDRKKYSKAISQLLLSSWPRRILLLGGISFLVALSILSWDSLGPTIFSPEQLTSPQQFIEEQITTEYFNGEFGSSSEQIDRFINLFPNNLPIGNILDFYWLPEFMQAPDRPFDLLLPILSVISLCLLLRFIHYNQRSRLWINGLVIFAALRYMIWRTLATLNLSDPISSGFSLFWYIVEFLLILDFIVDRIFSIQSTQALRSNEANLYSWDVIEDRYQPSVDVFIPTYNEPESMLRRTIVACQELDYANKTIYILDDTRRNNIRKLAARLGCKYITRQDNSHAKAGNLNNALKQTNGELIAVFDADFIPYPEFLTRTVGFFQKDNTALVQTPQYFYNSDHHLRNLGLSHQIPYDMSFFYHSLSFLDSYNAVGCCGSCYLVRRKPLEDIGGYVTKCLAEDFPTSTKLLTEKYRIVHLNEILSAGESTRTHVDFIKQRIRWHYSNYLLFFCTDSIPIWSKLNFVQKILYFKLFWSSFQPFLRLIIILMPLLSLYLGIAPLRVQPGELLYYALPWLLLSIGTKFWLSGYKESFLWSEVYRTILCWPLLKPTYSMIKNPFGLKFKVTRKGVQNNCVNYNLTYTWPLLLVIALSLGLITAHIIGFYLDFWDTVLSVDLVILSILVIYNCLILSLAFIATIDLPERRNVDRFDLQTFCNISFFDSSKDTSRAIFSSSGSIENISETGASLSLPKNIQIRPETTVRLELPEYQISMKGVIKRQHHQVGKEILGISFLDLPISTYRHLIKIIYFKNLKAKNTIASSSLDIVFGLISTLFPIGKISRIVLKR